MSEQIIQQPDGRFAIFSSVTDSFVMVDATASEVTQYRVEEAADRAREQVARELGFVTAGEPRKVYRQGTLSYEEAAELDRGVVDDDDNEG